MEPNTDSEGEVTGENAASVGKNATMFKLFVGQIPKEMNAESTKPYFEEFGKIAEFSIMRDNRSFLSRGCAFVTYYTEEAAKLAIETLHDKVKLPNSQNFLQVRMAEGHGAPTETEAKYVKLFVGMLSKSTSEEELEGMFSVFGNLKEVHIIRGADGSPQGCAFVKFLEKSSAYAAIEGLNDSIPMGSFRNLVVKFAVAKGNSKGNQSLSKSQEQEQGQGHGRLHNPNEISPGTALNKYGENTWYPTAVVSPGQYQALQNHQPPTPTFVHVHPTMVDVNQLSPANISYVSVHGNADMSTQQRFQFVGMGHSAPMSSDSRLNPQLNPQQPFMTNRHVPNLPRAENNTMRFDVMNMPPQMQPRIVSPKSGSLHPPQGPTGANLFIYHLPREVTDSDLATLFAPFGNVISAKVFVDKKTSGSKGFGFVSYDSLQSAIWAIEYMHGFHIGNKQLQVEHKWY